MKKFNLLEDVPYIHNSKELALWLRPLYVINSYMKDYDTYKEFMTKTMNVLKGCYTIYNCREYPVHFKFNAKDKEEHVLSFRHFCINMILWYPFVELNDLNVLDESFILDCNNSIPSIENYINFKLITVLRDYHVKPTTINYAISEVLYNLRMISVDFSLILGLNFSAITFFDMYNESTEIRDIMEVQFSENMQPHEIEQELHELQDKEIEIYRSMPENPIGVILRAQTGIKYKQFAEFTISEGLKPSLEGVTIPMPIENSTLLRGLDRPSYLYIDATGSRKSLVIKYLLPHTVMYVTKTSLIAGNSIVWTISS